jgi:hypothetical protein
MAHDEPSIRSGKLEKPHVNGTFLLIWTGALTFKK